MTKKKTPAKSRTATKKSKPAAPAPGGALSTSVAPTSSILRAGRSRRKSKYDAILEEAAALEPGKSVVIKLPDGVSSRVMQTRLASIESRRKQKGLLNLPEGMRLSHYTTDSGDLAIELVPA